MFYQIRASLFFDTVDEAVDFYHDCELALPRATVINPCTPEQQVSKIETIHCSHDVFPHSPCTLLAREDNTPVCL